jgi:hypothetical protein
MSDIFRNLAIRYAKYGTFITMFGLFILLLFVGYSNFKLKNLNRDLQDLNKEKDSILVIERDVRDQIQNKNNVLEKYYFDCINESNANLWEITKATNTLGAYSAYAEKSADDVNKQKEINEAVSKLLNSNGYVQLIETNGNPLFTTVNLSIKGEFIKFKTDVSVRNGAIGINDCGKPNSGRIGVILKGKIVRVENKCEASGSRAVWAKIAYSN